MGNNFSALKLASRTIEEDYDEDELTPVRKKDHRDLPLVGQDNVATRTVQGDIPKMQEMRCNIAVMEAIIDEILEDAEETADVKVNPTISPEEEAIQQVNEVAEKAANLGLIPRYFLNRIPAIIAKHRVRENPRMRLFTKAAIFAADENADGMDIDPVIARTIDMTPADDGIDTNNEVIEYTGDNAQEGGNVPTVQMESMKAIILSSINRRKAIARTMCHGGMIDITNYMLYELRHALPNKFKARRGITY